MELESLTGSVLSLAAWHDSRRRSSFLPSWAFTMR